MAKPAEIEILRKRVVTSWEPDVGEVSKTWVTFRDEKGRMDLIIVTGADPKDKEIVAAIKKKREEEAKIKPVRVPI